MKRTATAATGIAKRPRTGIAEVDKRKIYFFGVDLKEAEVLPVFGNHGSIESHLVNPSFFSGHVIFVDEISAQSFLRAKVKKIGQKSVSCYLAYSGRTGPNTNQTNPIDTVGRKICVQNVRNLGRFTLRNFFGGSGKVENVILNTGKHAGSASVLYRTVQDCDQAMIDPVKLYRIGHELTCTRFIRN